MSDKLLKNSNPKIILFDLDRSKSWFPHLSDFVYERNNWNQVLRETSSPDAFNDFFFELRKDSDEQNHPFAKHLCDIGISILDKNYTHVAAYHGCRINNQTSYRELGLLPSDIPKLIDKSKVLFDGLPGFEAALNDIGKSYINHNQGKIGFLVSLTWAKSVNNSYSTGSEFISALANRLGTKAKSRFSKTGKRSWIKCAVPIDWLDTETTFPVKNCYVQWAISGLIRMKLRPNDKLDYFDGGFLLKRGIPPENILKFINHRK